MSIPKSLRQIIDTFMPEKPDVLDAPLIVRAPTGDCVVTGIECNGPVVVLLTSGYTPPTAADTIQTPNSPEVS